MTKTISLSVVGVLFALLAFGAPPVGKVSSSEPFDLRGARVTVAGVPSWPLMSGDEIATPNSAAEVTLKDGSRVVLVKGSKAKVEEKAGKLVVRLLEGASAYVLSAHPAVAFYVKDKAAAVSGPQGVVSATADPQVQQSAVSILGGNAKPAFKPNPPPQISGY